MVRKELFLEVESLCVGKVFLIGLTLKVVVSITNVDFESVLSKKTQRLSGALMPDVTLIELGGVQDRS